MVSNFCSTFSWYGKSRPADIETGPQPFIPSYVRLKSLQYFNRLTFFPILQGQCRHRNRFCEVSWLFNCKLGRNGYTTHSWSIHGNTSDSQTTCGCTRNSWTTCYDTRDSRTMCGYTRDSKQLVTIQENLGQLVTIQDTTCAPLVHTKHWKLHTAPWHLPTQSCTLYVRLDTIVSTSPLFRCQHFTTLHSVVLDMSTLHYTAQCSVGHVNTADRQDCAVSDTPTL